MKLQDFLTLVHDLTAVLEEEIVMLDNHQMEKAAELSACKQRLSDRYILQLDNISPHLQEMPVSVRNKLYDAITKLTDKAEENERVIRLHRNVAKRFIEKIMEKAVPEQKPVTGYTATGKMHESTNLRVTPVTVNTYL